MQIQTRTGRGTRVQEGSQKHPWTGIPRCLGLTVEAKAVACFRCRTPRSPTSLDAPPAANQYDTIRTIQETYPFRTRRCSPGRCPNLQNSSSGILPRDERLLIQGDQTALPRPTIARPVAVLQARNWTSTPACVTLPQR